MTTTLKRKPGGADSLGQKRANAAVKKQGLWHGEPYVWLTSIGLSVGLVMILGLLVLIAIKGLTVFWPAKVTQVILKEDSAARIGASNILAGVEIKKQKKVVREIGVSEADAPKEWQLFIANRDVYGLSFRYVDEADILEVGYPENIIQMERAEFGDAIVFPMSIHLGDKTFIDASESDFDESLRDLLREVEERRHIIRKIEKKDIGHINYEMSKLQIKHKKLLENPDSDASRLKLSKVEVSLQSHQKDYEVLASRAKDLRSLQEENTLIYRLPTGEEKSMSLGDIYGYYYPNQLTFLQRLKLFATNLWNFVSTEPREANTEGGIFPAIFGTFMMTILMSVVVTPFGVLAAIYLREYAKQGPLVRMVRIAVNNLAGVPSIVFGVFGLGFFVYFLGGTIDQLFFQDRLPTPTFGTGGIMWASFTLALMTVPVVIVSTEEALAAVPRGTREGSLACGASKWQTIQRIVLPASAPGIMTGFILAMARGAGEVAPLMIVGVVKLAPALPLDALYPFIHLERKFMHLGFHIYDLGFQSPDSEAAKPMVFATTLVLITLVILLNLTAIIIREKLKKRYITGAF